MKLTLLALSSALDVMRLLLARGGRQSQPAAGRSTRALMAKVNQQISDGMEKGASSSIITLG